MRRIKLDARCPSLTAADRSRQFWIESLRREPAVEQTVSFALSAIERGAGHAYEANFPGRRQIVSAESSLRLMCTCIGCAPVDKKASPCSNARRGRRHLSEL